MTCAIWWGLTKRVSDIESCWVGVTEQNIADAFEEARKDGAVLLFDEADSFLLDRRSATRSWEMTKVNEFLQQMEVFPGVVACTTNLMDTLDQASLRRFDLHGVQAYDTSSKFGLKTAEIDRGCAKARREVRPCYSHFALYSVRQTANDLTCLGLSFVQRLPRCRWDWRQRWELSHLVVVVRCRCSRATRHERFLPH